MQPQRGITFIKYNIKIPQPQRGVTFVVGVTFVEKDKKKSITPEGYNIYKI